MESTKTNVYEKVISFEIDGNWSISEFSDFFNSLNFLYRLIIELDNIEFLEVQLSDAKSDIPLTEDYIRVNESYYKKIKNSSSYTKKLHTNIGNVNFDFKSHFHDLQVKKIKFSSPGVTDFIGMGKIIETLFELIKYYFPNKEGKIKRRIMEEDLISKKIENLNNIGYSSIEIEKYETLKNTAISEIRGLRFEEKITDIIIKQKTSLLNINSNLTLNFSSLQSKN